ncbi:methyl-accepting chemotaxis signaling domain, putative [Babesia ovis]|uniref:Methyl-accepting chemotaxis signaling domain, putative n=1 Tax=Babesia ovis TaxID=5869 RepID=A0A9W5TD89_BABOV|nr:methyl-accepting chemotaxis signaling domain, putative [Babesia ovis]
MKINGTVITCLLALAPFYNVVLGRTHVKHHSALAPSMSRADAADMDAALKAAAFTEVGEISEDAIDSVVTEMLSLLEKQGLNYDNPEHVNHFISFMETMARNDGKSKGARFLEELKKMATKAWHETKGTMKEVLVSYIKNLLKAGLKHALPTIEKLNEKAMYSLPVNLRVALSPIYYNMWLKLFEKAKLRIPPEYKIENFICKNIDKEECDEIISKVKSSWTALGGKTNTKDSLEEEKAPVSTGEKEPAAPRKYVSSSLGDDDLFDFQM